MLDVNPENNDWSGINPDQDLDSGPTPEDFYNAARLTERPVIKRRKAEKPIVLNWQVGDFSDVCSSIYEAVMVAAQRSRQVGRRQKAEIDAYNATQEAIEINPDEDEDIEEKGVDHFQHPKPTIKALYELKKQSFKFYYPDEEEK